MVIYEMHVRGFTADPSSKVKHPGTFLGIVEKIPYLVGLGVKVVELMPVFLFNNRRNYWGYTPLSFFDLHTPYGTLQDFRILVEELHAAGLNLYLDVVYNHVGRGVFHDTKMFFAKNYSGCDRTLNPNHPRVQELILSSLNHWIGHGVDGFRFDLASVLTRGEDGQPLDPHPLIGKISALPTTLIAEAWDAQGLYQLGHFPKWGPWKEWNGRFRDTVRRYVRGDSGMEEAFANAMAGSPELYSNPSSSINYITCHDGFTLRDLVSYSKKHNLANGESNRDGSNENFSCNYGVEGGTNDPAICAIREEKMAQFRHLLLSAKGIPMVRMGDEYGHTNYGNNNPWCQNKPFNFFQWHRLTDKTESELFSLSR